MWGCVQVTGRYLRHFNLLSITDVADNVLSNIFETILTWYLTPTLTPTLRLRLGLWPSEASRHMQ